MSIGIHQSADLREAIIKKNGILWIKFTNGGEGGGLTEFIKPIFFFKSLKCINYELLIAFSRFRGGFVNLPFTKFIFVMDGFPVGRVGINIRSQNQVKKGLDSCEEHFKLFPIICQLVFQTSIHKQPSQYMQYNKIVCFRKSTFQKKIKGIPSRTHFYSMSNILCNSLSHLKPT